MTNQQAINLLKGLEQSLDGYCELNDEGKTAFRMAIEALELFGNSEQLPPAQPDHSADVSKMVNGDVVSRREAIDAAIEAADDWDGGWNPTRSNIIEKAIENLPPAQPKQQWIPCKERMPNKDEAYLVSGRWSSGKESIGDCDYSKEDGYFHTAWNFDVLAWMPLPEPYKERREE